MTESNGLNRQRQNYAFLCDAIYSTTYGIMLVFYSQPQLNVLSITSKVLLFITSCSLGYVLWDTKYSNNDDFRQGVCQLQCINHLLHHGVVWGALYYYRADPLAFATPMNVFSFSLLNLPFGIIYLFLGFCVSSEECEISDDEESNKTTPLLECDHAVPLEENVE